MNSKRIRIIKDGKIGKGPIVYWMSRDQRVNDNWALIYAQNLSIKYNSPLIVLFSIQDKFNNATAAIFDYMLEGLKYIEEELFKLSLPFVIIKGDAEKSILNFLSEIDAGILISDFSPLKIKKQWNSAIVKNITIPYSEVDSHNIIPVWTASQKKEFGAYTLRKKILKNIYEFLEPFPQLKKRTIKWKDETEPINWDSFKLKLGIKPSKDTNYTFSPSERSGLHSLHHFINNRFKNYNINRNDPVLDAGANLSPFLHFGHISSQRVVLECIKMQDLGPLKSSFYDEIIVRKELSDNFCFYEENYDNFKGFPDWGKKTLKEHRYDSREYIYSLEEFERAKTHDQAWNAAQNQMIRTGKMHNYMRMYWAKKILEWTETPEDAQKIAIYLNDKYELDGRDPNGYTGIAWSIGGLHDRAWKERNIFGKVRYMSFDGLKRKFDIKKYIEMYQ